MRFLAGVVGLWTVGRGLVLWSAEVTPVLAHTVPLAGAGAARSSHASPGSGPTIAFAASPPPGPRRLRSADTPKPNLPRRSSGATLAVPAATAIIAAPAISTGPATQPQGSTLPGIDPPPSFRASRWSASVWAILRPDGRATPFASQLGGSQAGARVAYALDGARRLAAYARVSTAIDAREREGAVGLDWRPTRLPVHLVVERRVGIEGVRGGTALGVIGGVAPTRLAGPVRVESYAQAGVIFRDGREGFADGSLRLTVAAKRLDLGVGAWGGAQRDAARLDIGPTLGVTLPVERHALRLSVDWRQRVAGDARPPSGPAVSIGVDF